MIQILRRLGVALIAFGAAASAQAQTPAAAPVAAPAPAQAQPVDPCPEATAHAEAPAEARTALEACLAREGVSVADQAALWKRIGDANALLGQGTPTVQAYDRAEGLMRQAEIAPPPLMIATRGRALQLIGQDERALTDLNAALAARPNWARTRYYRALTLINLYRRDEAIDDLRRAARAQSMRVEANTALAGLLLAQGDDAGALTAANAVIAASADNVVAHQVRCHALARQGSNQAEAACNRALQLDAAHEATRRNYERARPPHDAQ